MIIEAGFVRVVLFVEIGRRPDIEAPATVRAPVLIVLVEIPVNLPAPVTSKASDGELLKIPTPCAVTLIVFTLHVPGVVDAFEPPVVAEYNQKSTALPKLFAVSP